MATAPRIVKPRDRVRIAVAHVDTVELFTFQWPDWLPKNGNDWFRKPVIHDAKVIGWRIIHHQPSQAAIRLWSKMQDRAWSGPKAQHLYVYRVAIAVDRMTSSESLSMRLHTRLIRSLFLKWARANDGTCYEGTDYARKPGARRNFAIYSDKRSKVTGEPRCRVELRSTSLAARRTFGTDISGVLTVNPRQLFERYVRDHRDLLLPAIPQVLTWPSSY